MQSSQASRKAITTHINDTYLNTSQGGYEAFSCRRRFLHCASLAANSMHQQTLILAVEASDLIYAIRNMLRASLKSTRLHYGG
jgi:sulfur relay (sulfurtransferase) DsrF/TusC family protein